MYLWHTAFRIWTVLYIIHSHSHSPQSLTIANQHLIFVDSVFGMTLLNRYRYYVGEEMPRVHILNIILSRLHIGRTNDDNLRDISR
jgi:hypothetical protein